MFIYNLESTVDKSQYIGMSDHPERRLKEHNGGKVNSIKSKRPWRKVWKTKYQTRLEARKHETYLKSAAGRRFRKTLSGN